MAKTIILSLMAVLLIAHLLIILFRPELLARLSWGMVQRFGMDGAFSKEACFRSFTSLGSRIVTSIMAICLLAWTVVLWRLGPQ